MQNGEFIAQATVDVDVLDAGTDSGASFTSGDEATSPAEGISLITTAPLGNGVNVSPSMGSFSFVKN